MNEKREKANTLRKLGHYQEALVLYQELWIESNDLYNAAGLLHCLRKLSLYDEALSFIELIILKFMGNKWCKNEVIWVYIEGELNKLEGKENLKSILQISSKIMELNPDELAKNKVVFKVLKTAKEANKWDIICDWVDKIQPSTLSAEPILLKNDKKGWSYKSLWYNFKIKSLIKNELFKEANELLDLISGSFPQQDKFFKRLKALNFYHMENFSEAVLIYRELLSKSYNSDWWLLHEYGKVLLSQGNYEEANTVMCNAAQNCPKLDSLVTLIYDIGNLCLITGNSKIAFAHLKLYQYIRERNSWSVPEGINKKIKELSDICGNDIQYLNLKHALSDCKRYWQSHNMEENNKLNSKEINEKRIGLKGLIKLGKPENPFCFLVTSQNESFFCYKSDLPEIIQDQMVIFDAVPSFNKKKNEQSWKAVNIRVT